MGAGNWRWGMRWPGPRCMVPCVKNVILASADQVAIDAVAANERVIEVYLGR